MRISAVDTRIRRAARFGRMRIDHASSVPPFEQVRSQFAAQIGDGTLVVGDAPADRSRARRRARPGGQHRRAGLSRTRNGRSRRDARPRRHGRERGRRPHGTTPARGRAGLCASRARLRRRRGARARGRPRRAGRLGRTDGRRLADVDHDTLSRTLRPVLRRVRALEQPGGRSIGLCISGGRDAARSAAIRAAGRRWSRTSLRAHAATVSIVWLGTSTMNSSPPTRAARLPGRASKQLLDRRGGRCDQMIAGVLDRRCR